MDIISKTCEWENRDFEAKRPWQTTWFVWELLILRHNNDTMPKTKMKKFLCPILILNSRSIKFALA